MRYKVVSIIAIAAVLCTAGITCLAKEIVEPDIPVLNNKVTPNKEGVAEIPEAGLMDYVFPNSIKGEKVASIADRAFAGCDYFRSVSIPEEITEIGANAFSDCKNLEYIILEGRSDTSSMTLGKNWSGGAKVCFEYNVAEDAVETEENPEAIADNTDLLDDTQNTSESAEKHHIPSASSAESSTQNHTDFADEPVLDPAEPETNAASANPEQTVVTPNDSAVEVPNPGKEVEADTNQTEKISDEQQEGGAHQDESNRNDHQE